LLAQLSRKHEFEADAYAVTHTSGPNLAHALLKLYQDNASTLTPDPLYVKFYYSHPPGFRALGANDRLTEGITCKISSKKSLIPASNGHYQLLNW
jgi:hypothetical protein